MMLHSEFCAVWLSLLDVTGKKRTLLINIHIEQVPVTLTRIGLELSCLNLKCCESYFWLPPASVERRAVIRAGERCVLQCRHCNAAIGILNYQPLWNPMPKVVYSVGWL